MIKLGSEQRKRKMHARATPKGMGEQKLWEKNPTARNKTCSDQLQRTLQARHSKKRLK